VGDLPTRAIISDDVGSTVYINGVASTAVDADVGQITWDATKQVFSDQEVLDELNDARILTFKGQETSLETLDEIQERIVAIAARIEITLQMALDSTRYVRYQAQSVNAIPVSPSELINLAKHLEDGLKKLAEEIEDDNLGAVIQQTVFRIHDRHDDLIIPTEYSPPQKIPAFTLTEVETGVSIYIPYTFINDYASHYIRKTDAGVTTILVEYFTLEDKTYIDTDVEAGKSYTYELFVQTINNILRSSELVIALDANVDVYDSPSVSESVVLS
jgi:hypothetical protein